MNDLQTERASAIANGEREGAADYRSRAEDVRLGEDPEWAWPLTNADQAYIDAVGVSDICKEIGLMDLGWEDICDDWIAAFRRGYEAAHWAAQ